MKGITANKNVPILSPQDLLKLCGLLFCDFCYLNCEVINTNCRQLFSNRERKKKKKKRKPFKEMWYNCFLNGIQHFMKF